MTQPSILDYLPESWRTQDGSFTREFIRVLDRLLDETDQEAKNAEENMFLSTASGRFLNYLASKQGFNIPDRSGFDSNTIRALAPLMTSRPKQIIGTMLKVLEAVYGTQATRPSARSVNAAPYSVINGDSLRVQTNAGETEVFLLPEQFSNPNSVSAAELSSYLNSKQNLFLALVEQDRTTGLEYIRIAAAGYGPGDWVRVTGGSLQNVLRISFLAETNFQLGTTWDLTKPSSASDELTFTWNAVAPNPQAYNVSPGDIVTIRGLVDFDSTGTADVNVIDSVGNLVLDTLGNQVIITIPVVEGNYSVLNGTHEVIDAGTNYFTIRARGFQYTAPIPKLVYQTGPNVIVVTRPTQNRLYDQPSVGLIVSTTDRQVIAAVDAVSPVLLTNLIGSGHIAGNGVPVLAFSRTQLQIGSGELPQGENLFHFDGSYQTYQYAPYKTTSSLDSVYEVSTTELSILPHTDLTSVLAVDALSVPFESDLMTVEFGLRHGMLPGWGLTILDSDANPTTPAMNTSVVNGEFLVQEVLSPRKVLVRLPVKNTGGLYNAGQAIQLGALSSSGADLLLNNYTGPTPPVGSAFRIASGVLINSRWSQVVFKTFVVVEVNGVQIYLKTGIGPTGASNVTLASTVQVRYAQTVFGGTGTRYRFDPSSVINSPIMAGLVAEFMVFSTNDTAFKGSYVYDTEGYRVGPLSAEIQTAVLRGRTYQKLIVDNASDWPQTGYLVLGFGTSDGDGPIRYLSRTQTEIFIDPAYRFRSSHAVSAAVQQVSALEAPPLNPFGLDRQTYVTGNTEPKNALYLLLNRLLAAGVLLVEDETSPQPLYADPSVDIYE